MGVISENTEYHLNESDEVLQASRDLKHTTEWLKERRNEGVFLVNGSNTIQFMMDKSKYLQQLQREGIPTIPTLYIPKQTTAKNSNGLHDKLLIAFDELKAEALIVKSTDFMSGKNHFKFSKNESDKENVMSFYETVMLFSHQYDVLVQCYMPKIKQGAISFFYFADQFYYRKKIPKAGEYKVQAVYGGRSEKYQATKAEIQQAKDVIKAIERIT